MLINVLSVTAYTFLNFNVLYNYIFSTLHLDFHYIFIFSTAFAFNGAKMYLCFNNAMNVLFNDPLRNYTVLVIFYLDNIMCNLLVIQPPC